MILFTSCKKDNSFNPSNQEIVTNSNYPQNADTIKNPLNKFEGLDLSKEMLEKITFHTDDPKIIKVIENSLGLENLLGHPVLETVTVINPDGTRLENFDANLNYKGDVVVENGNKRITVFRASFVSHKGDQLINSNDNLLVFSDNEDADKVKPTDLNDLTEKSQTTNEPIFIGQNNFTGKGDSLSFKSNFDSQRIQRVITLIALAEKKQFLQNNIFETFSRINFIQDKLKNPVVKKTHDLYFQFKDELKYQYDLLDEQRELIKEFDANKLLNDS